MTLKQRIRKWNHRRIDAGRAAVLALFKWLFDRKSQGVRPKQIKDVLIFRLDGKVGDSITTSYMIDQLVAAGCKVTVLGNPNIVFIYSQNPQVKTIPLKKGLLKTLAFVIKHRHHYDVAINTSHIVTSRVLFLMRSLNINFKIGFASPRFAIFDANVPFNTDLDHVSTRYKKLLELLAIEPGVAKYSLELPKTAQSKVADFLAPLRKHHSKIVILNSFAGARMRSLSASSSQFLVESILQAHPQALIVSIGNHNDLPRAVEFIQSSTSTLQKNWIASPSTDFFFNAALVKEADLVISPDTAIVHLCSVYGKNLVALYRTDEGPEKNAQIWAPIHKNVKVLYSKNAGKPEQDINDIDLAAVAQAANEFLSHT